jgi:UDP-glucose 4-epimerase
LSSDPAKKTVIVTGGAGFIGSHTVVELIGAGFEPVIVDNFSNSERSALAGLEAILGRSVRCHEIDCNDGDAMRGVFEREGPVQGVIHFAAFKAVGDSVARPLAYYANNVGSLITLMEVMQEFDVRDCVFSSSCTVYGQPDTLPVTEESPCMPAASPYGHTKQVCESVIEAAAVAKLPLRNVVLRYFNPIGAHPSSQIGELPLGVPSNLVPFIAQTAAGLRDCLTVFGDNYETPDGSCIRDYIHVVDLAVAHVKSLQWLESQDASSLCEVFNVGTGGGSSVLEAIAAFERASGRSVNYHIGERRPGDIEKIYADAEKAERVLQWKAERSMDDAMRDAWNWQRALAKR